MKKIFANKKLLLLSFLIPFALATLGYHFVFICDASVRGGQAYSMRYPDIPIEKAVELEENKRWRDWGAWGIHALIFGVPTGLIGLAVVSAIQVVRHHSRKCG
jgi:hypothetical protein